MFENYYKEKLVNTRMETMQQRFYLSFYVLVKRKILASNCGGRLLGICLLRHQRVIIQCYNAKKRMFGDVSKDSFIFSGSREVMEICFEQIC